MTRFSPYSKHYEALKSIGHNRPTSAFGAPTLAWHLGMWPLRQYDPTHVYEEPNIEALVNSVRPEKAGRSRDSALPPDEHHKRAVDCYLDRSLERQERINRFLLGLQSIGRQGGAQSKFERIDPDNSNSPLAALKDRTKRVYDGSDRFGLRKPEAISFTLWWPEEGFLSGARPDRDALRVRVHSELHADFWTMSFFIDVRRRWLRTPSSGEAAEPHDAPLSKGDPKGTRREKIFYHVSNIERHCGARVLSPEIENALLPERIEKIAAEELSEAAKYLYKTIWGEFCKDFEIGTPDDVTGLRNLVGDSSRVFFDFCGLVIPTMGADREQGIDAGDGSYGKGALKCFRNGANDSNPNANEANAVVRAYWPFFRRVTPDADNREVVASTVLSGKAIYITTLGSIAGHEVHDEIEDRALEVPHDRLPEEASDYDKSCPEPVRYLFLTKGQPHRRQIGRIIDRINAMGTLRTYALKDWHILQNASVHIRMRGQELDQIIQAWGLGRAHIDKETGIDYDFRDTWVGEYTRYIEARLLSIGAALDKIGSNSIGGIHYRINSSRYYVKGFRTLLSTLAMGSIDTWISYNHFVDRGLQPAFDFIDNLGRRLDSLRSRLQSVTEGIQTSALVAETNATRENTMELRRIAQAGKVFSAIAGFGATLGAIRYALQIAESTSPADEGVTVVKLVAAVLVLTICVAIGIVLWLPTSSRRRARKK